MSIKIHQTHHNVADFENIFSYLETQTYQSNEIHVFPELFLTGYPLADLCLNKSFILSFNALLNKIKKWSKSLPADCHLFMGGLDYQLNKKQNPESIKNVIYEVSKEEVCPVYTKQLLPNYDIFDEKKYFTPGQENIIISRLNIKIALLICEDMWTSNVHSLDPVKNLEAKDIDLVLNLSASPFHAGKSQKRVQRATEISHYLKAPFIYVNRVGGEDEILFDGRSFVQAGNDTVIEGNFFKEDLLEVNLEEYSYNSSTTLTNNNTWESLYCPRLKSSNDKLVLAELNEEECFEILEALKFGFKEYARKSSFNNFTIALSGGVDSALVLTILRLALSEGQYLEAVYMPSKFSSSMSYDLSVELSKNLGVPLYSLPIKFLHSTAKNIFGQTFKEPFEGITDENIQARLRGTLLYTRSNQINSMVVNTSNKSELAVGYSTQYGDSVGAISLLGDLYKSQVFTLCRYINKTQGQIIPEGIIDRPPTAELREGQTDNQSLPDYPVLDTILESLLTGLYTQADLSRYGLLKKDIQKVFNLYKRCEYKRSQFCPIIKVSSKSFGFGYRVPISKDSSFYSFTGEENE